MSDYFVCGHHLKCFHHSYLQLVPVMLNSMYVLKSSGNGMQHWEKSQKVCCQFQILYDCFHTSFASATCKSHVLKYWPQVILFYTVKGFRVTKSKNAFFIELIVFLNDVTYVQCLFMRTVAWSETIVFLRYFWKQKGFQPIINDLQALW